MRRRLQLMLGDTSHTGLSSSAISTTGRPPVEISTAWATVAWPPGEAIAACKDSMESIGRRWIKDKQHRHGAILQTVQRCVRRFQITDQPVSVQFASRTAAHCSMSCSSGAETDHSLGARRRAGLRHHLEQHGRMHGDLPGERAAVRCEQHDRGPNPRRENRHDYAVGSAIVAVDQGNGD
jgi:hypothetical protein